MPFPQDNFTAAQMGNLTNFLRTTLSADIGTGDLTIPVASTTGFPDGTNGLDFITIGKVGVDPENIRYTSLDATNFYCTSTADRGYGGGTAYAHNTNDYVRQCYPAEIHDRIVDTIANLETFVRNNARAGVQAVAAYDMVAYKMVCFNVSGQFIYGKADALATSLIQGMLLHDYEAGASAFAVEGMVTNTNWNWTAQNQLWLSDAADGDLVQARPMGNWDCCCAVTQTATTIRVHIPSYDITGTF